jgi:hypothetical protein
MTIYRHMVDGASLSDLASRQSSVIAALSPMAGITFLFIQGGQNVFSRVQHMPAIQVDG